MSNDEAELIDSIQTYQQEIAKKAADAKDQILKDVYFLYFRKHFDINDPDVTRVGYFINNGNWNQEFIQIDGKTVGAIETTFTYEQPFKVIFKFNPEAR